MTEHVHIALAKITPPRVGVPLLPRERLLTAVREGVRRKLLVLSAEAGYGKTALLVSALPELDLPVAWFTLDETDADLNLFSAGLIAALRTVAPEFGPAGGICRRWKPNSPRSPPPRAAPRPYYDYNERRPSGLADPSSPTARPVVAPNPHFFDRRVSRTDPQIIIIREHPKIRYMLPCTNTDCPQIWRMLTDIFSTLDWSLLAGKVR